MACFYLNTDSTGFSPGNHKDGMNIHMQTKHFKLTIKNRMSILSLHWFLFVVFSFP